MAKASLLYVFMINILNLFGAKRDHGPKTETTFKKLRAA